jgi:hypothetical protein
MGTVTASPIATTSVDPLSITLAYAVAALQNKKPNYSSTMELTDPTKTPSRSDLGSYNAREQCLGSGYQSDDNSTSHDDDGDASKRLARSRERNREHARRTRLRKKAQLEALQSKVEVLEVERDALKQKVEECSIASILLGLSSKEQDINSHSLFDKAILDSDTKSTELIKMSGKRKRFLSDASDSKIHQPMKISIDGQLTLIGGGKSHVNWKTGVYSDEQGNQRHLTPEQLEGLR